jgi:hypothetical protein
MKFFKITASKKKQFEFFVKEILVRFELRLDWVMHSHHFIFNMRIPEISQLYG